MKYLITLFFYCFALESLGQDSASSFWQHQCEIKTEGKAKAVGLKMLMNIPCSWKFEPKKDVPNTLGIYHQRINDTSSASVSIMINDFGSNFPKEAIDKLLTQKGMKEMLDESQELIKATRVTVGGSPAAELLYDQHQLNAGLDVYSYSVSYLIYYKRWIITLVYSVGSVWVDKRDLFRDRYTLLFRGLASGTLLLNK